MEVVHDRPLHLVEVSAATSGEAESRKTRARCQAASSLEPGRYRSASIFEPRPQWLRAISTTMSRSDLSVKVPGPSANVPNSTSEVTQPGRRAASATATGPAADMASSDTGGPTARTTSASSSTLASIP